MVDIYVGENNSRWVVHEKLLCHRSNFFRRIFTGEKGKPSRDKEYSLPDEDNEPFQQFVGWLYSGSIKTPTEENDLTSLFDLYLMGEKWQIKLLLRETLDTVRDFYHKTGTYPGLRRVQYIYANTEQDSPMRHLLVDSVARLLTLANTIPQHWDKALRKNGQLAVDIIKSIQKWHLKSEIVPDAREMDVEELGLKEDDDEDFKQEDQDETQDNYETTQLKEEADGGEKPTVNGETEENSEERTEEKTEERTSEDAQ